MNNLLKIFCIITNLYCSKIYLIINNILKYKVNYKIKNVETLWNKINNKQKLLISGYLKKFNNKQYYISNFEKLIFDTLGPLLLLNLLLVNKSQIDVFMDDFLNICRHKNTFKDIKIILYHINYKLPIKKMIFDKYGPLQVYYPPTEILGITSINKLKDNNIYVLGVLLNNSRKVKFFNHEEYIDDFEGRINLMKSKSYFSSII